MLSRILIIFSTLLLVTATVVAQPFEPNRPLRIAVLGFGEAPTARLAHEALSKRIADNPHVTVVDRDQAVAAANGVGYRRSLNLSLQEARDLGSAIGCDFFVLGEADTLRRSPSDGPSYFESYASLFIVSGRTGRLVMWENQIANRPTAENAERALLAQLSAAAIDRYVKAILRAAEDEKAERAARVEDPPTVIEVMPNEELEDHDTPTPGPENPSPSRARPPRPFRRLKPAYPEAAAHARVEAVVDVLVDVDEKGEVSRAEIARWAGYGLDESVLTTVKQLHFFPAMRAGRAIPMRVLLRYNFRKPKE